MPHYEAFCQPLCKLDETIIGKQAAQDIAALYQGPGSNRVLFGKRVARVVGRQVAYASLARHTEHYRETVAPWPDHHDQCGNGRAPRK